MDRVNENTISKQIPIAQMTAVASCAPLDSAGLPLDVKEEEPLVNDGHQDPPTQNKSRGWNLAAEAAASGKRIMPKK